MLHILCGKMASGKSILAQKLSQEHDAVLISEDVWLEELYGDEIDTFEDYIRCTRRLRTVLFGHVQALLRQNIVVVMDFSANTVRQREWFKKLFEAAGATHTLHYIVASDDPCKKQLKKRSQNLPEGTKFTTEVEFDMITDYFEEPLEEEGFYVKRYERS